MTALAARPVWRAEQGAAVLAADARRSDRDEDALSVDRWAGLGTIVVSAVGEHLLLSNGCRSLRVDFQGARIGRGTVRPTPDLLVMVRKIDNALSNGSKIVIYYAGLQAGDCATMQTCDDAPVPLYVEIDP